MAFNSDAYDCGKCLGARRTQLGCEQPSPGLKLLLDAETYPGVALDRCPHAQIFGPAGEPTPLNPGKPRARRAIHLYSLYSDGFMLYGGGVADQPAWYIQEMLVVRNHVALLEKQEADEAKKKK